MDATHGRRRRLALTLAWHPEWRVAAIAAGAWLAVFAGLGMHHAHVGMHHSLWAPISGLGGWSVMVVAMMVPVTLPVVRYVGLNSMRARRQRAMTIYTAAFVAVWVAFGVTALGTQHLLSVHAGLSESLLLTGTLLVAAGWQLTRAKRRALFACNRTLALPPVGRRADARCARLGMVQGLRCMQSCGPVMLVMVAAGHSSVLWMVALSALVVAEELTVRGRWITRPAAAALALAAIAVAL